jgi:hypothetical protein
MEENNKTQLDMKRYYYLPKGSFYAFDIYANSLKEVKQKIKALLDIKTLHGVQVWLG